MTTQRRLGELAIDERLLDATQLGEALEAQVVHGGRLGTNLLELGFVDESQLVHLLGLQLNMPVAGGVMEPDPKALALIDAALCDKLDVLPMRVDATKLHLAVLDPRQVQVLDDLSFQVGKRLVPVVVPEFRLNQLLRKYADAFRPVRTIDVLGVVPKAQQQAKAAAEAVANAPEPVPDLINEEDFAQLYARQVGNDPDADVVTAELAEDPAAVSAPRIAEPINRALAAATRPEPTLAPLDFTTAQQQLAQSSGREDIARILLRYALSRFRRAILLSVQRDLLLGWRGAGEGVREKAVRRIGVSLREANTFALVKQTCSHFVGPLKRTPGTTVFFRLLGGGFPQTAVVMPILVRSRPVHLLYVDMGPDQLTPPDLAELLILSQSVARNYEDLILRHQR